VRQIRMNAKLETLRLPALRGPENDCSMMVRSCSAEYRIKPYSCHRFYKCVDGVAYSCQNPKSFNWKCSERYWAKQIRFWRRDKQSRMDQYQCPANTAGPGVCQDRFDREY